MSILHAGVVLANRLLGSFDGEVVRKSQMDHLRDACRPLKPRLEPALLPDGAAEYLRPDNPNLQELRVRYRASVPPALRPSRWTEDYKAKTIDLRFFRSYNSYVFSDANWEFKYAVSAYYARCIDTLGLLRTLTEDGLFGCPSLDLDGTLKVSRDLLDSILEIHFLERAIGISQLANFSILDVGAGYGRLAHRAVKALPMLGKYLCTDAVAESTFLSQYYVRYREVSPPAHVVPFDELERTLKDTPIDLAINIHSFSECTLEAIRWWIDFLKRNGIRYLMIVPNAADHGGTQLLTQESESGGVDFLPLLQLNGYCLVEKQPKYRDQIVQRYGISSTYHYLFELR